jgi:CrcB protein
MAPEADVRPFRAHAPRRKQDARVLLAVAVGGFLGGEARYLLGLGFPTARASFPAAIFAVNVSGAFILGLLLALILEVWRPTTYPRPLWCTGFCGAYTTFSTWMVDTDRLVSAGRYGVAAANLFGALAAGLVATRLGANVGKRRILR